MFDDIGLPLPYGGGLLLGRDFNSSLRAHPYAHLTWAWKDVHELIFARGILESAADLSVRVARFREALSGGRSTQNQARPVQPDPGAVSAWVAATFQRSYEPPKY